LDFTEITITRRMYRSGESEYLLNHAPCRLMDIHELLHDSGLGRDAHSIISQGQLDEILNSRPEDRRALVEEAANVLKHKKRRERAVRKLTAMDGYLERARDVICEVDRQLKPLARQATRAAEHGSVMARLRDLDLDLAVDDLRKLQGQWEEVSKAEKEADAELELIRYRHEEKERELTKFQSLLEEKGLFVGDLSEQRRRLQSVLERINSGLLLLEEKGKNLVDRLSDLRAKLHHSEARIATRTGEMASLTELRSETDGQLKAHYSQLGELRRESETSRKERTAADEALASVTAESRRSRKELEDARLALAKLEQTVSSAMLERDMLEDRRETLREQRAAVAATLAARRTRLEQLESDIARVHKNRTLADGDVDKRVRVLESRRKDLTDVRETLTGLRGEMRGLEEVDRAFASASPALAWAMSKESELTGLIGPIAEVLRVPSTYERLVEHVLGSDLFALLVSDRATAARIAGALGKEAEGEIAIVPLDTVRPTAPKGIGKRLVDTIECDERYRGAVEALLGDVYIADSLDAAIEAASKTPGSRYATAAGEVAWPSGKITAGRATQDTAGVLERKRRMNEIADEIEAVGSRVGDAEMQVSEAEEALAAAQQDALELGQQAAALSGEHDSLREEVGRLETTITGIEVDIERLAVRGREIADRLEKDEPARVELTEKIAMTKAMLEKLEEDGAIARERRDDRFREEAAIGERLSACQVDIATVSEREVHLKKQITAITAELKELENTVVAARETEEALELLRERVQPVHDLYSALLESAEHWAHKLRDRARFEQADSESLRETIHAAQDAVKAVQAEIDEHNESMSELRVRKGQFEIQVSTAAARIVEELGIPLERALDRDPLEDRDRAQDKAHRLRKQLENMGPVNPIAMQEHDSLKERREFL
ncbi:MAG: coiled-coil domain-containing protein, partial [Coriobacteriia bacterium]